MVYVNVGRIEPRIEQGSNTDKKSNDDFDIFSKDCLDFESRTGWTDGASVAGSRDETNCVPSIAGIS
jgi:hypothetical protein